MTQTQPGGAAVTGRNDWGHAFGNLGRPGYARRWHWIRVSFSAVWLVYLAQPLATLPARHPGPLWLAVALTVTAAFVAAFVVVVATWDKNQRRARWGVALLFPLTVAFSLLFSGPDASGNVVWIYVASAAGWVVADRRALWRMLAAILACYALTSWLGRDSMSSTLVTLIPIVCVLVAMSGMRRQMTLMGELRKAREEVGKLAANEERLRLARDVHDLTGQSLSMITLKSELAGRLLGRLPDSPERDRVRDEIEQVAAVSRQALHDIREAISGYRRPTLAVEAITARTALTSAGITPHDDTALTTLSGTFHPEAEGALAWCLREAVTNVIRHSGAKNCHVSLAQRAGAMSLTVRDDGAGAGTGPASGSGLHGMAERLNAVGGGLEVRPSSGGFCLVATVPEHANVTV